jgi:hypothetical protein
VDIKIEGAAQLRTLSTSLKTVAPALKRNMTREFRVAARPLIGAAEASAREMLPKRGGLAAQVADSSFKVQVRTGPKTAGIRIVARGKSNIAAMDAGIVRHPRWGHRDRWFTQSVRPGWFTKPMEAGAEPMQRAALRVMDATARAAGFK